MSALLVRLRLIGILSGLLVLAMTPGADACACCSEYGQRNVSVQQLNSYKHSVVQDIRFSKNAELFLGLADPESVKGISNASANYTLELTQQKTSWTFRFTDKQGHVGSLILAMPSTVSVFEIDPRKEKPQPEGDNGPQLYKEWKLTAKAVGTGIFSVGMGSEQRITLIFQGHGNSCTTAEDFSHWTIVVHGPKAEYSFFGELVPWTP